MKRVGDLYSSVVSLENLWQGFLGAKKSKGGRRGCFQFEKSLGRELASLQEELEAGTYKPRPYFKFIVYEPKIRDIYAPAFRDCVVQYAIYNALMPIFEKTFIDQSFACRVGLGTHAAADYAQNALRRAGPDTYTLQLDIKKFFYSIDRPVLRQLLEKKIKDKKMVDLMMLFADYPEPTGIPIGNLLSQMFALIYMNPVDHYATRVLKPAAGYCRYVDDFLLFGLTRDEALDYRVKLTKFVNEELKLTLSRSTIANTRKGVNFCGYRTWRSGRFIRKYSLYKSRKAVRKNKLDSFISHLAHASKTRSLQHLLTYAEQENYGLYCELPKIYHKKHHKTVRDPRVGNGVMYNRWGDVC
ncbi:reverse transcriptase domain-containing protein [Psychrobacter sp. 72-O-c]|uniref:reverse transcriptase domain-containing protein n=1 Tax=Psychrobacter sp. 72-O-c TaxID=2774125 RepID=UPI001D108BED|nr:reverse transcriptase domain-containing protein [Psychrobacter sp. 72-O-c]